MLSEKLQVLQKDVIEDYVENNFTLTKIKQKYKIGDASVYKIFKENNIKSEGHKRNHRKYELDEHVLDEIDSEEKAYFLGFFMADGYNAVYKRSLSITLNEDDVEILERFQKLFKTTSPIVHCEAKMNSNGYLIRPTVSLTFNSIYLNQRLNELGCPQNKSLTLKFPEYIDETLLPHFIRGYFDGDGCIHIKDRKHNYLGAKMVCSIYFGEVLIERLKAYDINCWMLRNKKGVNENTCEVGVSRQKDVKVFLDWLYKEATIYLSRKYQRYYDFYYTNKEIKNIDS